MDLERLKIRLFKEKIRDEIRNKLTWFVWEKGFDCGFDILKNQNVALVGQKDENISQILHQKIRISELEEVIDKVRCNCNSECKQVLEEAIQNLTNREDLDDWLAN